MFPSRILFGNPRGIQKQNKMNAIRGGTSLNNVQVTPSNSVGILIHFGQFQGNQLITVDQQRVCQSLDTLGCPDIVKCIMTFLDDKEFLPNFMNYMKAFEDVIQQDCYQALARRGVHYCTSIDEMKFLSTHLLPNEGEMKGCSQIVIDGLVGVGEWEDEFRRGIGYFPIVHLNGSSLSCRNLVDLIKLETSQIQHLMLSNVVMLGDTECLDGSVFELTPSLTRISFDINRSNGQELCNPILRIGDKLNLVSSNIQELCFLKPMNQDDSRLIEMLRLNITKFSSCNQQLPGKFLNKFFTSIYQFTLERFPSQYVHVPVLDVRRVCPHLSGRGNSQVLILRSCEMSHGVGLSGFIRKLLRSFDQCKELILSESFASILNKNDFTGNEIVSTLDKITIKYSKHSDPYKYGLLKYALRINFPERVEIVLEEIENLKKEFDFDYFEPISYGPFQLCPEISDCKANETFKRIEQVSAEFKLSLNEETCNQTTPRELKNSFCTNRFKYNQNEEIRNQLRELKKSFGTNMFNFNEKEWKKNMHNLNILEGLLDNKRELLQSFGRAIDNFCEIFFESNFSMLLIQKYKQTMISLEKYESRFAEDFGELVQMVSQMKHLAAENSVSYQVLLVQEHEDSMTGVELQH